MVLADKLRYLRKQTGLSQLDLSEKLQVSRQAVSGWEAGMSKPSTENLKRLGALYGVPLEYLLNDNAPEPVAPEQSIGKVQGRESNIKKRRIALILVGIGIVAAMAAILFYTGNETKGPVPIENIQGKETETDKEIEFEIDW